MGAKKVKSQEVFDAVFYLRWLRQFCGVNFGLLPMSPMTKSAFDPIESGHPSGEMMDSSKYSSQAFDSSSSRAEVSSDFFESPDPWIFIGPRAQDPLSENPTLKKLIEALSAKRAIILECSDSELESWLAGASEAKAQKGEELFPEQSRVVCFSQAFSRKIGSAWKGRLLALDHPVLMAQNTDSKRRAWALLKAWV